MNQNSIWKMLFILVLGTCHSMISFAQEASVAISLSPAGSFKLKSVDVSGSVEKKEDSYEGKNIKVGLKNLTTGISLRDEHTKKWLEVGKFPEALLVSALGKDGKGTGVIRIKGIEKKIEGTFNVQGKYLEADFSLNLPDFKIENVKYMGVGVEDEVKVHVSVPILETKARLNNTTDKKEVVSPANSKKFSKPK